ncbi:LEA type 2 family protein [Halarchaeum sp. CBA1220]|uniref:LEA type 2 family protein n=1 Tax=Halarchaeum sp. CBA1220 TaxID=1853682 RepID=UPI000F3A96E6|nr:LEA type 2 family protein [Halarchaeum sp. CBA1220]QLC34161.1 LEA type 2 family protein [Halarchaeum sp. CBA1220]
MDLRALALESTLRAAVTVVLAFALVTGGAFALGWLGVPSVVATENAFGGVNETTTTVDTAVTVHNPNPVGVRFGGVRVNYTVSMNDIAMAHGRTAGVGLDTGNTTLRFESYLRNERIPAWWASHVRNGEETTVQVAADVRSGTLGRSAHVVPVTRTVSTNISGQFNSTENRPINAGLPLVSDPVLVVRETRAHWGLTTDAETPLETTFVVHNPKATPVTFGSIGYDVAMNGVDVGEGESERAVVIPGGATRTVRASTVLENDRLDEWWVTHLERNQTTDLRIDFYARLSLGGGESVRVPLRGLTFEETIRTDIFGTKNATDRTASDGGSADETTTGPSTTASGESPSTTDAEPTTETTARSTTTTASTSERTTTTASSENGSTTTADGGLLAV